VLEEAISGEKRLLLNGVQCVSCGFFLYFT